MFLSKRQEKHDLHNSNLISHETNRVLSLSIMVSSLNCKVNLLYFRKDRMWKLFPWLIIEWGYIFLIQIYLIFLLFSWFTLKSWFSRILYYYSEEHGNRYQWATKSPLDGSISAYILSPLHTHKFLRVKWSWLFSIIFPSDITINNQSVNPDCNCIVIQCLLLCTRKALWAEDICDYPSI